MRTLLPFLLLLACPIAMMLMMRGGHGGHGGHNGHNGHNGHDARDARLAELEREVARLRGTAADEHAGHPV